MRNRGEECRDESRTRPQRPTEPYSSTATEEARTKAGRHPAEPLRDWVRFDGLGVHRGTPCRAQICPAPPGYGLRLNGAPLSPASILGSEGATTLSSGRGPVSTAEHLLAALSLAGVWDAAIEVEGGEVPILDGSAAPFLAALPKRVPEVRYGLREPVSVSCGSAWIKATPAPWPEARVMVGLSLGGVPQRVSFRLTAPPPKLAAARTFGFLADAERLRARGLAQGASFENTLVLGEGGEPLNRRFAAEPAWHKALDLLGDLALLGAPLCAHLEAHSPTHALNAALMSALFGHLRPHPVSPCRSEG